jgi:hypothetical protein
MRVSWCVFYRKADGKGTRLWAAMPGEALALQQFDYAVSKAARGGMTMIWVTCPSGNHAAEHVWTARS